MKDLTKEQIKDRLLKRTAEIWDVDELELEYSFDPIISLIYDTFSHELLRVSDTIKSSRTRITERLVDLLTPEVSTLAKPAHAILHSVPLEATEVVNEYNQFIFRKRAMGIDVNSNKKIKEFYFSPTGEYHISNCDIKYIVGQNKATIIEGLKMKEFLTAEEHYKKSPEYNTFWIGLKTNKELESLQNVMLYFNTTSNTERDLFLSNLANAEWKMNDETVSVKKGYNTNVEPIENYKNFINESVQTKLQFYQGVINSLYEKHFITLNDDRPISKIKKQYPDAFKAFINSESLKNFDEDLIWVKVKMSSIVNPQLIENIYCYVNCYPVINKKLIHKSQRSQKHLNIVPLAIENDFFLDLQQIDTSNGDEYLVQNRTGFNNNKDLKAHLRYGGVARFDERDASELLHYLLDVLKEDSVAYNAIGDDFINTKVTELRQIISSVEQKIERKDFTKSKIPYLVIENDKQKNNALDTFFISYWTTNGSEANKIHPFMRLHQYKGTSFKSDSIMFVTGTIGGENEPKASEKVYAYRENILSRGRVVTNQDIVNHCFNHYKSAISNVSIKKGVQVQQNSAVGYTPTIDVYITKNIETTYEDEDWQYLKESLENSLLLNSANVLPFRVMYKQV